MTVWVVLIIFAFIAVICFGAAQGIKEGMETRLIVCQACGRRITGQYYILKETGRYVCPECWADLQSVMGDEL